MKWSLEYGTNIVGGITPGRGGEISNNKPVFDTVQEAVEKAGANASVIFVPAAYAKEAALEAIDAGLDLVVFVPEHIPVRDTMTIKNYAQEKGIRVIGPNAPGIISPGIGKLGIMPAVMFTPGRIGVVSRSGTLSYEVSGYLNEAGFGQSTMVGMGGDPIICMSLERILAEFEADPDTDAVVLVGEIGGSAEEIAAEYVKKMSKPVVCYIAGRSAPHDKRMGHAGAIIKAGQGTVESKRAALEAAGAKVALSLSEIPVWLKKVL
jgi:succinyl-CoA synthetase alpha subunit